MYLLWRNPAALALCYAFISFLMLLKWHTKGDLLFYFFPLVLGPIAEMIAVYNGVWKYAKPFFLIPIWLPFGWGIFFLLIKKITDTVTQKG